MRLTDTAVDDRLREAIRVLGHELGETTRGDTAMKVARQALYLVSLALINAGVKADG